MSNLFDLSNTILSGQQLNTDAGTGVQDLLNRIVNLMLALAFPLAFIGIVFSAWKLISSAGNAAALATAKKNIIYITIGIAVLTLGLVVIKVIYNVFGTTS